MFPRTPRGIYPFIVAHDRRFYHEELTFCCRWGLYDEENRSEMATALYTRPL
jgi:hypothetical protein